jgi:hypothetical protein
MNIKDPYELLKRLGLTTGRGAFSRDYLGRSPRYLDYLLCSGAQPSIEVLTTLAFRLSQSATSQRRETGREDTARVLDLASKLIWAEIEVRSLPAPRIKQAHPLERSISTPQLGR